MSSPAPARRLLVAPLIATALVLTGGTAFAATRSVSAVRRSSVTAQTSSTAISTTTNAGMLPYASYPQATGPRITPTINKTGRQLITKPGIYSGWNVTAGNIDIQSNGGAVILENFIVDARGTTSGGPIWVRGGYTSPVEVRYGRVIGAGNVSSTCINMLQPGGWAHHLDISNCEDGARVGKGTIFEANWIHGLYMGTGSHNDGMQLQGTESDVEIRQNRIDGRYRGQTSAILVKSDTSNIARINVHHNYLSGGAYTVYAYDAGAYRTTDMHLDNNVFMRGTALYAQLATLVTKPALANSGIVTKVGNTWDDGTSVWGASSTPPPTPSPSSTPAPVPSPSSTPAPVPSPSSTPAPVPSPSSTPAPSPSAPPAGVRPAYASYPTITGSITAPSAMPIQKTGLYIISSPGTYSGIHVTNGNIEIRANDVKLTDFAITNSGGYLGTGNLLRVYPGFARHEFSYGTLSNDNGYGWAIYPVKDTYAHHLNISGTGDGLQVGINGRYEYLWVHDLITANGGHVDAIQLVGGREGNTEIAYSRLEGPFRGQTSAIIIKSDLGNIDGVNVHDNYLSGGSYTVYVYDWAGYKTTNVRIDRNVFVRGSALYGTLATNPAVSPITQIASKVGNTWDDGSLIWG